jgi:hypothetical protein
MKETSKWGRWQWPNGLGRWHAVMSVGQAHEDGIPTPKMVVLLACGRVRAVPKVMALRPGPEQCCPTCAHLDDLRIAYVPEKADAPARMAVPAGHPAEKPAEAPYGRPVAPLGICLCGCDKSDEARAYEAALAEWEQAEKARKYAEWEAHDALARKESAR